MGMNWAQMFRDEQSRWTGAYNAVANENTYALTRNAIREGIFEAIEYEQ